MKINEMKSRRFKVEAQDEEVGTTSLEFDDHDNTQMNDWAESGEQKHSPQPCSRWTPENTRLMLQLRFDRQHDFQQRLRQKKELWSEIAAEMRNQGQADFTITAEVCDLKYRNMLQTYKKNRLKEDSGMQSLIVWEYYELFKEALKASEEAEAQEGQERVVPSMLCESVCEVGNVEEDGALLTTKSGGGGCGDVSGTQPISNADVEMLNGEPTGQSSSPTKEQEQTGIEQLCLSQPISLNYNRKRTRTSTRHAAAMQTTELPTPQTSATNADLTPMTDNDAEDKQMKTLKCSEMQRHNSTNNVQRSTVKRQRRSYTAASQDTPNEVLSDMLPSVNVQNVSNTPLAHHEMLEVIVETPSNSELREYQVFGESVGLQLANVKEAKVRAYLQFKIQELFYKAKTGKLLDVDK